MIQARLCLVTPASRFMLVAGQAPPPEPAVSQRSSTTAASASREAAPNSRERRGDEQRNPREELPHQHEFLLVLTRLFGQRGRLECLSEPTRFFRALLNRDDTLGGVGWEETREGRHERHTEAPSG